MMQATTSRLRGIRTSPVWTSRNNMLPCRNPSQSRFSRQSQSGTLTEKKCEPCEPSAGSLNYMGLCMALSRQEAEEMLAKEEVQGWKLQEDGNAKLHILKQWKSKNFVKGWNNVEANVWTHARDGLTENDFILAAKLNKVPKDDLLRKPKKKF